MLKIVNSIFSIKQLEDFAKRESHVHLIHPLIKLLTTIIYIFVVVSFDKYEISGLIPLVFFPILLIVLADLPIIPIIKRVLLLEPFIIGVGILNLIFDKTTIFVGNFEVSGGWITLLTLIIKSGLTVTVSMLLVATTGMDKIASALRMLKIPKILVLQLLLTYRYISVLIEEVLTMLRAYYLRAPGQKGIESRVWGSFLGQLLLRTFDRAHRIYQAMILKGFSGEYNTGGRKRLNFNDIMFFFIWNSFFILIYVVDLSSLLGKLLSEGGVK